MSNSYPIYIPSSSSSTGSALSENDVAIILSSYPTSSQLATGLSGKLSTSGGTLSGVLQFAPPNGTDAEIESSAPLDLLGNTSVTVKVGATTAAGKGLTVDAAGNAKVDGNVSTVLGTVSGQSGSFASLLVNGVAAQRQGDAVSAPSISLAGNDLATRLATFAPQSSLNTTNSNLSAVSALVGSNSVASQISSATANLASQSSLATTNSNVSTLIGNITTLNSGASTSGSVLHTVGTAASIGSSSSAITGASLVATGTGTAPTNGVMASYSGTTASIQTYTAGAAGGSLNLNNTGSTSVNNLTVFGTNTGLGVGGLVCNNLATMQAGIDFQRGSFGVTLSPVVLSSNQTISLPNESGTLALAGDPISSTGAVSGTSLSTGGSLSLTSTAPSILTPNATTVLALPSFSAPNISYTNGIKSQNTNGASIDAFGDIVFNTTTTTTNSWHVTGQNGASLLSVNNQTAASSGGAVSTFNNTLDSGTTVGNASIKGTLSLTSNTLVNSSGNSVTLPSTAGTLALSSSVPSLTAANTLGSSTNATTIAGPLSLTTATSISTIAGILTLPSTAGLLSTAPNNWMSVSLNNTSSATALTATAFANSAGSTITVNGSSQITLPPGTYRLDQTYYATLAAAASITSPTHAIVQPVLVSGTYSSVGSLVAAAWNYNTATTQLTNIGSTSILVVSSAYTFTMQASGLTAGELNTASGLLQITQIA